MAQDIRKIKVGMSLQEKNKQANDVKIEVLKQTAGGSPRGKFANIEELRRRYPNGNQYIYITENNGYWNYYDYETRQWSEGGSYLEEIEGKQDQLVSGVNIKTINGNSILGGGNLEVGGGTGTGTEVNANVDIPTDIPLQDIKIGSGVYDLKNTYATKDEIKKPQEITLYCDDRSEITGYTGCSSDIAVGSVGSEEQIKIPTIKGRTERASYNLANFGDNIPYTKVKNGVLQIDYSNSEFNSWFLTEQKNVRYFVFKCSPSSQSYMRIYFSADGVASENYAFNDGQWHYYDCGKITNVKINMGIEGAFKGNVYIMASDEPLNDLPFKPYNDNLVNSNNILVSTGKNVWSLGSADVNEVGYAFDKQPLILEKGNYYFVFDNKTRCRFILTLHDRYDNAIFRLEDSNDARVFEINLEQNCYKASLYIDTIGKYDFAMYYHVGPYNSQLPIEPYKDNRITRIGELGQFDYVDNVNNKKHIKTSGVIKLNGSENWEDNAGTNNPSFKRFILRNYTSLDNANTINLKSNWTDKSSNETYSRNDGISIDGGGLQIYKNDIQDLQSLKSWLSNNSIQLVYKLKNEVITNIVPPLQDTMAVALGGMQYQEPVVENAPVYDITKIYEYSIQGQINANIQTDVEQQKEIDALIVDNKRQDEEIATIKKDTYTITLTQEQLTQLAQGQDVVLNVNIPSQDFIKFKNIVVKGDGAFNDTICYVLTPYYLGLGFIYQSTTYAKDDLTTQSTLYTMKATPKEDVFSDATITQITLSIKYQDVKPTFIYKHTLSITESGVPLHPNYDLICYNNKKEPYATGTLYSIINQVAEDSFGFKIKLTTGIVSAVLDIPNDVIETGDSSISFDTTNGQITKDLVSIL